MNKIAKYIRTQQNRTAVGIKGQAEGLLTIIVCPIISSMLMAFLRESRVLEGSTKIQIESATTKCCGFIILCLLKKKGGTHR